jgi:hypothetical protein
MRKLITLISKFAGGVAGCRGKSTLQDAPQSTIRGRAS